MIELVEDEEEEEDDEEDDEDDEEDDGTENIFRAFSAFSSRRRASSRFCSIGVSESTVVRTAVPRGVVVVPPKRSVRAVLALPTTDCRTAGVGVDFDEADRLPRPKRVGVRTPRLLILFFSGDRITQKKFLVCLFCVLLVLIKSGTIF